MQISLRDLIIPLLGSQTWPAGLFQGPPLQVCFHYSQLRITIPGSLLWNVFQQLLCFSIILNLKSAIYWISSIVFVSSVRSSYSHPDLLVITTSSTHFFRSHRSSTLDFHFLSHYSFIKAIMLYESFSDVGEIRVYFASKILTPCRMH